MSSSSAFDVAPREEPLPAIVQDALETYRQHAEAKDISFDAEVAEEVVEVDAFWFDKAVRGLLHHAVAVTPPDGAVVFRATCHGDELVVSVRDTSPHIRDLDAADAFQDLETDPSALPMEDPDQAPGLDVTRLIAEAHGGRAWAERPVEGRGKTLHLALPITQPLQEESIQTGRRPHDMAEE